MGFLDSVNIPGGVLRTPTPKRAGGFLSSVSLPQDQARATEVFRLRQQAEQARRDAEELSSLGGIVKETGKGIFRRILGASIGAIKSIFETQKRFLPKVSENIREGAKDIEEGNIIKGIIKSGARTAGDAAILLFAPISAAIGAALELTGGQQLIDKAGEIIADKSGITDNERFQRFAIEHPNAGEDFERLLFLVLVKGDKSKIDPNRILTETRAFANKIVASEVTPKTVAPPAKGGFLETVVKPERPERPVRLTKEITTGRKPSGIALDIEAKAIEAKLTKRIDDIAGFDPIKRSEQIKAAVELVNRDIEKAKRIMRGEELPPTNILPESILLALEEGAFKARNFELIRELGQSSIVKETSTLAQRFGLLAERASDSPVKAIQDIVKFRETKLEGRTKAQAKQIRERTIEEARTEIKKTASKRPAWEDFINELKCNF